MVLSIEVAPVHYMPGSRVFFSPSGNRTHPVTLLLGLGGAHLREVRLYIRLQIVPLSLNRPLSIY